MHYHGPIVRPQTDADSIFVEVTVGCTHNNCTFCNFYDGYPFRVAPLSQVEADLQEAAANFPHAKKVWASGGNPFALSVNKLATLAKLFKKYLPEAIISTYARVDDITSKSVDDLKMLRELGFEILVLGIETGDDDVLTHVKKGYTSKDILRECKKIESAGIAWRVIYLGGLAGEGKCVESAKRTAAVLNELHPFNMMLTTVAVLRGTELYNEMQQGKWVEAGEKERLMEFRTLLAELKNPINVYSVTSTVSFPFVVDLPEGKKEILRHLDDEIASVTEDYDNMVRASRARMTSV